MITVLLLVSVFLTTSICAAQEAAIKRVVPAVHAAQQDVELGEPALSRDKALQKAREMFPELLKGKDINVELQDYAGAGRRGWRLDWDVPVPGVGQRIVHNSIMLDADTGALISMFCSEGTGGAKDGVSLVTREMARQKAEDFVKKFRPSEFARVRPVDSGYAGYCSPGRINYTYNFFWERVENGIPVDGDGITVAVDALSGRVIRFTAIWHDDAVFPEPKAMFEDRERQVLDELGLILCYKMGEGGKSKAGVPEASLVYQLNSTEFLRLDPYSGDALTPEGEKVPIGQYKCFSGLPDPFAGGAASGKAVSVGRPANKITTVEAMETAREFFKKLGLEGEVTRSGSGSSSDGIFYDEEWMFSLKEDGGTEEGGPRRSLRVGIDTRTGEVSSYHDSGYYEYAGIGENPGASGQTVTRDAARAKALDFIRLVHPEKLGQVIEKEQNYEYCIPGRAQNCFNFVRLGNGIPFMRDGIRVIVNSSDEVVSYDCDWHVVRFPDAGGVITREEAEKVFLENMSLMPAYFFPQKQGKPWAEKSPMLSLRFDNRREFGVNAHAGQLVAMDWGRLTLKDEDSLTIRQDHWAAAPLEILANNGLLPEEGFDPDGPVSRRDAVRVLMSAAGYGYRPPGEDEKIASFSDITLNDRDYSAIQAAVRKGMLKGAGNFTPERPVTRETLAVWLVRLLGYDEVAAMPVKIELKTADAEQVPEKSRNYVAIACGLGLMHGDDKGYFRPADHATWAELAVLITRAAPRLQAVHW